MEAVGKFEEMAENAAPDYEPEDTALIANENDNFEEIVSGDESFIADEALEEFDGGYDDLDEFAAGEYDDYEYEDWDEFAAGEYDDYEYEDWDEFTTGEYDDYEYEDWDEFATGEYDDYEYEDWDEFAAGEYDDYEYEDWDEFTSGEYDDYEYEDWDEFTSGEYDDYEYEEWDEFTAGEYDDYEYEDWDEFAAGEYDDYEYEDWDELTAGEYDDYEYEEWDEFAAGEYDDYEYEEWDEFAAGTELDTDAGEYCAKELQILLDAKAEDIFLIDSVNFTVAAAADAGFPAFDAVMEPLVIAPAPVNAGRTPRADFNVSGQSDVIIVQKNKLSLLCYEDGEYSSTGTLSNLGKWTLVEPEGDYNGDGRADALITAKTDGIRTLAGLFNIGEESEVAFKAHNIFRYRTAEWSYRGEGDINGDGISDIVIVQTGQCAIEMGFQRRVVQAKLLGEDGKVAETVKMGSLPSGWYVFGLADIDGDGTSNILMRNIRTDMVAFWKEAGADSDVLGLAKNLEFLAAGDFDGDGADDLLWRNADDELISWSDLASETITEVNLGSISKLRNWTFEQVGDYDGDGCEELLWSDGGGRLAYSNTDKPARLTVIAK